jgi:hypothetical protein
MALAGVIPDAVADRAVYYRSDGRQDRLFVADLRTRTSHRVALALAPGERIDGVATDGRTLVLLVWRRINPLPPPGAVPCNGDESHPLAWRLLAAPLSHGLVAGAFNVLAAGRSSLVFAPALAGEYCPGPLVPRIAVASGRVAYAIEDLASARPAGARIIVRSLASGAIVRSVTRPGQVVALALSASAIAWLESANAQTSRTAGAGWAVRRALLSGGASSEVNVGAHAGWPSLPDRLALDGASVVVAVPIAFGMAWTVERIPLGGSAGRLNPPGTKVCDVVGAAGSMIAMSCDVSPARPGTILLWRPGHGAHPLPGLSKAVLGPASIAWTSANDSAMSVVRLADLRWP